MFRTALAIYVLTIHRTAEGGLAGMKPAKLRNDLVDMMFLAFGTYFDGVLTADSHLQEMYGEVCILLFGLFDRHIAEGFDPLAR